MRYGTVPVGRKTGGLKDTVIDIGEEGGYGITHTNASVGDITHAVYRSVELFEDKKKFREVRKTMMKLDFSWLSSAKHYLDLYKTLK
jgi:starch synthase